jgi:hypothetical protein
MPIRWLTGMQKLESGQTVGRCNVCKMEFVSSAASQRTAQDELRNLFDTHVCHSGDKTRRGMYTTQTDDQTTEDATGH